VSRAGFEPAFRDFQSRTLTNSVILTDLDLLLRGCLFVDFLYKIAPQYFIKN
jgi:hypothetical protein